MLLGLAACGVLCIITHLFSILFNYDNRLRSTSQTKSRSGYLNATSHTTVKLILSWSLSLTSFSCISKSSDVK